MAKAGTQARTAPRGDSLRGRLPALGAVEVDALRRLCAAQLCWPLPNDRMFALAPLRNRHASGSVFELDGEGTRFAVRLDRNGAPTGSPDWSDYAGRARLLAWSLANEQALVQLSEALGVSLVPVAEHDAGAGDHADATWLAFSLEDLYEPEAGNAAYYRSGDLRLPAAWLTRLLARAEPLDPDRPQPSLARWNALPAPVAIACAGPRLAMDEWAALRPGDVLVLGSRKQPPPLHAATHGLRWPIAPAAEGHRIAAPMQTTPTLLENTPMNTPDTPAQGDADSTPDPAGAADAATRALPVLVEFELGRLELTVGELAGLQPGYVFPLPAFVEGTNVTIRANGRASARGELVAVGDTLGVRLVAWD